MSLSKAQPRKLSRGSGKSWKPRSEQLRAVKFLLENAAAILAAEPGVGKTSCTFAAISLLRKKGMFRKALVIAPLKPAYLVWPLEAQKWNEFKDFKLAVLHGKGRTEEAIQEADICVINPEGIDWLTGAKRAKDSHGRLRVSVDMQRFKSFGFDVLAIDELTRFKNHTSGRFKILKEIHGQFSRRWGLTGSLVANGLEHLFAQCYVIDGGRTFGKYITHFRNTYFRPDYTGFGYVLQHDGEERIRKAVAPLILSLEAKGLPDVVEVPHYIELPTDVRDVYDQMEDEFFAMFGRQALSAATAGVASTKCAQIASGGIYFDDAPAYGMKRYVRKTAGDRMFLQMHDEKTEMMESIVEELQGAPMLVAYGFGHDLVRLKEKWKTAPVLGSGTKPEEMRRIEQDWNGGRLPLLFGSPQSMAHGLNFQESGNHICWYTLTWDYEIYDQMIRRLRRHGSKHKQIFVHHLLARNTVDELKLEALREKATTQTKFVKYFTKYQASRRN